MKKQCKECSYITGKGSNFYKCFTAGCPAYKVHKGVKPIKKIALEDIMLVNILSFCENAAELGCPKDEEVDMWIRNLADKDLKKARKVMSKLLDIMERDNKGEEINTKFVDPL
jgi:hypothetical protein